MRWWVLVIMLGAMSLPARAQPPRAREIREVLESAAPGIRRCMEQSLRRGERPTGAQIFELHVETSGRVRDASLSGGPQPQRYVRCATGVLGRLRFAPQAEPLSIRYPLNIHPID